MKKRIIAVILILATAFSVVSCTKGNDPIISAEITSSQNGETTDSEVVTSDTDDTHGTSSSEQSTTSETAGSTDGNDTTESDTKPSTSNTDTEPSGTSTSEQVTTTEPTTSATTQTTTSTTTTTTTTTEAPTTTKEPEPPTPVDDGTRVHSWLTESFTKVLGTDIGNDNGNVYSFKEWFGVVGSPFTVVDRNKSTGELTVRTDYVDKICTYKHESTICGTVVRVNKPGQGNVFNLYSNPGLFYMLTNASNDLLLTFTAPEDGTYRVRASAKRSFKAYNQNGVVGTGSRFFIEAGGHVYDEGTDHATDGTRRIALEAEVTLKKGETVYFGHDPIPSTNPSMAGAAGWADDSVIDYFIVELLEDGTPSESRTSNKHTVEMSKNELESFQISVNSIEAVSGLSIVQVSAPVNNIFVEMLEEYLVMTNEEPYPDGMVTSNGVFYLKAKETKTFLVRFKTNKNTKAGTYTYKFELRSPSGWVLETYTVTLKVWNFALPDDPSSDALSSVNKTYIMNHEGIGQDQIDFYYKSYYDLLLDYKVNAYYLPYDILDPKADAYMSDPRVGSFQVWSEASDDMLVRYYNKLKSNPEWLEKAYFYPFDEPTSIDHLNQLAQKCERLKRLCPEIKIVIPFFVNLQYSGTQDEIDFLDQYLGIWCPKSACWNPSFLRNPLGRAYFGDRMEEQKAQGDKLWWYVCWEPGNPYCNLYVNELGIEHRELFWQQYDYGVEGLLYWQSNTWGSVSNPWTNMATVPSLSGSVYGDGSLMYPGRYVGVGGPCASLRLEAVRNGIEDYDLLLLAEKYLGKAYVDAQINKITTSLTVHADSDELFAQVRAEIGDKLSEHLS